VLLIVRLDRLARHVAFIANLMESGAGVAAVAEHACERIPQRTKAALVQVKVHGTPRGNPRALEALPLANAAKAPVRPAPEVRVRIMS
jgi:hypothetical protein